MASRESHSLGRTTGCLSCSGPGDDCGGHKAHTDQHQQGTPRGHHGFEATADAHSNQTTRTTQAVGAVVETRAIPGYVENTGHRHDGHDQPDGKPSGDLTELTAFAEHGQTGAHHGHGQQDTSRTDRPAETRVEETTKDTGPLQVDRQARQEATDHQQESEDLVAPPTEGGPRHAPQRGLAELSVLTPAAARPFQRRFRLPSSGLSRGGAPTGRSRTGALHPLGPLRGIRSR